MDKEASLRGEAALVDDALRADIYGVIGKIFEEEVTVEFFSILRKSQFFEVLRKSNPELARFAVSSPDGLESLRTEFTRLFVGPAPAAPPYGTIYREDDPYAGQLRGKFTGEIERFMAFYGLETVKKGAIPDHISILFEFMEKVIRAGMKEGKEGKSSAYEESGEIQRRFFRDYIVPWVDTFFRTVLAARPHPFYATVTEFAGHFVKCERVFLCEEP